MKSFLSYLNAQQVDTKYATFSDKILLIGYGSVGQAILPLILRHIKCDPIKITVLEKDNNKRLFDQRHGDTQIKYVRTEINKQNYSQVISQHVSAGGLIVNCALNIDAASLLVWCMDNGVMQVDTSLERWKDDQDENYPDISKRTLHETHHKIRSDMGRYIEGWPTCVVTHGANPGYVSHLTKRALLDLVKSRGSIVITPTNKEQWAQLMKRAGVKVIHVAERDTQVINVPKEKNEFVNTWSCEGFWAEGRAPAEMGWGTHEAAHPEGGRSQRDRTAAYLNLPGVAVLAKSWVPKGGQYNGFVVQHSESITISEYFSTEDGKYRPSVYYVYHPCIDAIASIHEMKGNELELQTKQRVVKTEVVSGMDELGVLLIGDGFSWWHGSQMTIEQARAILPGETPTSLQVAGSLLGAIVWMIDHPQEGYTEPDSIPFDLITKIGDNYWKPLASIGSRWQPNVNSNSLFKRKIDSVNPCRFENFRIWD